MESRVTVPTAKPLCPPLWLLPNQWKLFEAAGYDMRHAKRTPLTIPTASRG